MYIVYCTLSSTVTLTIMFKVSLCVHCPLYYCHTDTDCYGYILQYHYVCNVYCTTVTLTVMYTPYITSLYMCTLSTVLLSHWLLCIKYYYVYSTVCCTTVTYCHIVCTCSSVSDPLTTVTLTAPTFTHCLAFWLARAWNRLRDEGVCGSGTVVALAISAT